MPYQEWLGHRSYVDYRLGLNRSDDGEEWADGQ